MLARESRNAGCLRIENIRIINHRVDGDGRGGDLITAEKKKGIDEMQEKKKKECAHLTSITGTF